jgi:hypothetical protein
MLKKIITLTMLAMLIIGCTPGENSQSADLPPAENTSESAVNPVEEAVDNDNGLGVVVNPDTTLVAPSGSVDLDDLPTPVDTDEAANVIVQPAPGIPDPEVKMVQLAAEDLAERLSIDIGEVTLVEAISKDWPDSGLGCPSPDLIYAAFITPGFEIVLEAEGQNYTYHTDTAETVVLCVDGQPAE